MIGLQAKQIFVVRCNTTRIHCKDQSSQVAALLEFGVGAMAPKKIKEEQSEDGKKDKSAKKKLNKNKEKDEKKEKNDKKTKSKDKATDKKDQKDQKDKSSKKKRDRDSSSSSSDSDPEDHRTQTKGMLGFLSYHSDPLKNKKGKLLTESQKALEDWFLNLVPSSGVCFCATMHKISW